MDPEKYLERQRQLDGIRAIAQEAAQTIMEVYNSSFKITYKDDRSPLTEADHASHALIRTLLADLEPTLPVLSEESAEEEVRERLAWQHYWLVDPLDGTKEFIKRNGEFTVNIALIERSRAVLGVVVAPALGLEYSGALGLGAWKRNDAGQTSTIRVARVAQDPVRVVGSRSHSNPELSAYLKRMGPHEFKPMGSSLKICLVADGQADVYPRLGPTSEWDTAAAQAILESAGGCMMDTAGNALRYNTREHLANPHFVAFSDLERDWLAAVSGE